MFIKRNLINILIILLVIVACLYVTTAFAEKPFDKHWHDHQPQEPVVYHGEGGVDGRDGINGINGIDGLDYDENALNRSIASMAALSSIPSPTRNQRGFSAAFGAHSGEQAFALGYALNANDKSVKIGISKAESEKPVFGMGVLFGY